MVFLLLFFFYCLTKLHSWKQLRGLKPCQQPLLHKLPKSPLHAHRNQAELHHQKKKSQVIVNPLKIHPYTPALRNGFQIKICLKLAYISGVSEGSNDENIQHFVQIEHVYRIVLFVFKIPTLHMRSTYKLSIVFYKYIKHTLQVMTTHWRDAKGNMEPQLLCNNPSQTTTWEDLFCLIQVLSMQTSYCLTSKT